MSSLPRPHGVVIGQWIGDFEGTNSGLIVLNVDHDRPTTGVVQVLDPQLPLSAKVDFDATSGSLGGRLRDFRTATLPLPPDRKLPTDGTVTATFSDGDRLNGTWTTDQSTSGRFSLRHLDQPSAGVTDETFSWADFRAWALETCLRSRQWVFRGHSSVTHPLLTAFHRTGRRDLERYDSEDVIRLQRSVEATLGKKYDLRDATDYGALLNLGQHHGFPTPLLDWTFSPFVAAFFAFEQLSKPVPADQAPVRIFALNMELWPSAPINSIADLGPRFSRLFLGTRDNPRAMPQQSVNFFSNVVDIEHYVSLQEQNAKSRFLFRFDIPASERAVAMRDLEVMGITAATLFPGLDGTCRALAESWF
jgi:hypothetical protein